MPGMVTGTEYGILILGLIGCVIFGVVATVVQMIRKKK
jgi:Flp pilus assembly pilin Flp